MKDSQVPGGSPSARRLWPCALLLPLAVSAQTSLLHEAGVDLMRGYPVAQVSAADLDGDGLADLAGISFIAFPDAFTQDKLLIQLQVPGGAGAFRDAQSFPVTAPQDLLVADLDADGDADIAVVQDDPADALAIWINQGGAQGGSQGHLMRLTLTLAQDLAARVLAIDLDANPATPPALLLVRGIGRDSLLYASQLHLPTPTLALQQSLPHPGAVGAAVGDFDADGFPDLLIHGDGCRLWRHQVPGSGAPYVLDVTEPCGAGMVHAARIQASTEGAGQFGIALARSTGDVWVTAIPNGYFSLPLPSAAAGITRAFAFIDADGDGDQDLIAARPNENAPALTQRGSPVYRRTGTGFEGTLQTLPSAWSVERIDYGQGNGDAAVLAHPHGSTTLWQASPANSIPPVVQFVSDYGVYPAPSVAGHLQFQPFAIGQMSVHVDAVSNLGGQSTWSEDVGAGTRTVIADAPVFAPGNSLWTLNLTEVAPAGSGTIGIRNSMQVSVVAREPPEEFCFIEALFNLLAFLTGHAIDGEGSPGSLAQLDQLRRVRDERLAASAAGVHYIGLYTELQPDLYAALIADPQFALQLWALKDAWMPAIDNWLDGDARLPVSNAMQDALSQALTRMAAHGSRRLHEAVLRERRALGLDQLQGHPISALQLRWERSPMFSSGFD